MEETEFQNLVELLIALVGQYRGNPVAIEAILSEFKDVYRKVPIYPGIISALLPKVIRSVEMKELTEGEEVILTLKDGRTISGKVAEITPTEIKLAESHQLTLTPLSETVSVGKDSVEEAKRISRELLAKEWPSLNFEEE